MPTNRGICIYLEVDADTYRSPPSNLDSSETTTPSALLQNQASATESMSVRSGRTLPSPQTNWQISECGPPNVMLYGLGSSMPSVGEEMRFVGPPQRPMARA